MPGTGSLAAALLEQKYDFIERQQMFVRGTSFTGAAGQFPHIYCTLASADTVNAQSIRVLVSTTSAQDISIRFANFIGTGLVGAGLNFVDGGPVAQAELRTLSNAALQGTEIVRFTLAANVSTTLADDWSFRWGANRSLVVAGATVATTIKATFFWVEEDA